MAKGGSRRSLGSKVALAVGALAIAAGGYMFVTGVFNTVNRVRTQVGAALDPTSEMQALTGAPGSSVAQLSPGTYQIVAVGPNLTDSQFRPGSVNQQEVTRRAFEPPDIEVVGPTGKVRLSSPTVNFVVDSPDADAASLAEFTVGKEGSYQLFAKDAGDGSVQRLGIRERDDVGEIVTDTAADFSKIMLGALLAVFGVVMVVVGLISRRRGPAPATVMVRNPGGIVMHAGGPSATGGMRTPIAMQPDVPVPPRPAPAPPAPASAVQPPPAPAPPTPVPAPAQPSAPAAPPVPPPPPMSAPPSPPVPSPPAAGTIAAEPSWPPKDWPPAQPGRPGSPLPPPPPPA
jgi:hypothetical protein